MSKEKSVPKIVRQSNEHIASLQVTVTAKDERIKDLKAELVSEHENTLFIHKLLEKCRHKLARHEWIPVGEGLPEDFDDMHSKECFVFDGIKVRQSKYHHGVEAWYHLTQLTSHKITHWKPISLPTDEAKGEKDCDHDCPACIMEPDYCRKKICKKPVEMRNHWYEDCNSDKPTANCLTCENWKGSKATFLPECKYRNDHGTCCDMECKLYGQSCSKLCDCPEAEKDEEQ